MSKFWYKFAARQMLKWAVLHFSVSDGGFAPLGACCFQERQSGDYVLRAIPDWKVPVMEAILLKVPKLGHVLKGDWARLFVVTAMQASSIASIGRPSMPFTITVSVTPADPGPDSPAIGAERNRDRAAPPPPLPAAHSRPIPFAYDTSTQQTPMASRQPLPVPPSHSYQPRYGPPGTSPLGQPLPLEPVSRRSSPTGSDDERPYGHCCVYGRVILLLEDLQESVVDLRDRATYVYTQIDGFKDEYELASRGGFHHIGPADFIPVADTFAYSPSTNRGPYPDIGFARSATRPPMSPTTTNSSGCTHWSTGFPKTYASAPTPSAAIPESSSTEVPSTGDAAAGRACGVPVPPASETFGTSVSDPAQASHVASSSTSTHSASLVLPISDTSGSANLMAAQTVASALEPGVGQGSGSRLSPSSFPRLPGISRYSRASAESFRGHGVVGMVPGGPRYPQRGASEEWVITRESGELYLGTASSHVSGTAGGKADH
ncbi:uncharacterized protein BXZ73DRAFT_79822 [Epithele typhae]|uniref:uncharacterized protein n=1 Tax=Epithele typhae TaxID=378194 RepID=UPI0020088195|nr:uncharacterized protein BXZ73DRAFT_79822 [Epithele typhae]KAH9921673.1 hypothetical protein BXZ73DRAFT_79822 [Epithele typhae]